MSTNVVRQRNRFSWARSSAIAVAVAIHALAFLLMIAPVTPPPATAAVRVSPPVVTVIEPTETLPPLPPPPEPPVLPVRKMEHTPEPLTPPVVEAAPVEVDEPALNTEPVLPAHPQPPTEVRDVAPSTDIRYSARVKPSYPAQAIRQRHEGKVVLLVLVAADGTPKEIKVADSSGHHELDRAAVNTAWKWRFHPGSRDGVPIEAWARVPIDFQLNQL